MLTEIKWRLARNKRNWFHLQSGWILFLNSHQNNIWRSITSLFLILFFQHPSSYGTADCESQARRHVEQLVDSFDGFSAPADQEDLRISFEQRNREYERFLATCSAQVEEEEFQLELNQQQEHCRESGGHPDILRSRGGNSTVTCNCPNDRIQASDQLTCIPCESPMVPNEDRTACVRPNNLDRRQVTNPSNTCADGSPRPENGQCPGEVPAPPSVTGQAEGGVQASYEYTRADAVRESRQWSDDCQQTFSEANTCCMDPMQCLFGVSAGSTGEVNAIMSTVIGIGGTVIAGKGGGDDPKSIKKACDIMKTAGYTVAGLNGAAAFQCRAYQSACRSTCKETVELLERRAEFCGFNLSRVQPLREEMTGRCEEGAFRPLSEAFVAMNQRSQRCDQFNTQILESGVAGINATQAAKMSDLCLKAVDNVSPAGPPEQRPERPTVGTSDCTNPANANDPACSCSHPAFANTPRCRGLVGGQDGRMLGGGASLTSGATGFGDRGGSNTGELPLVANQLPPTQNIEAEQASSTGIQPDMMGANGMGMMGGPGMMPAGGGPGGPPGEPGFDTDVLSKNAIGGGGYSVSPGPGFASGGGFSGYGTGGGAASNGARDKLKQPNLNLKDFLPGGGKDPTRRMAGVAGTLVPEEERRGASHHNIFQMISDRYVTHCRVKGLLGDCLKAKTGF